MESLHNLSSLFPQVKSSGDVIQADRKQRHARQVANVLQRRERYDLFDDRRLQKCQIQLKKILNVTGEIYM